MGFENVAPSSLLIRNDSKTKYDVLPRFAPDTGIELACRLFASVLITQSYSPGARFSKVPKLYGPFSGVTIPL